MNGVVYAVRAEELQGREMGQPSPFIVGNHFCTGVENGSRGIAIVRNQYQETSSEDSAGWGKCLMFTAVICKL
jgi:hypothetical protein